MAYHPLRAAQTACSCRCHNLDQLGDIFLLKKQGWQKEIIETTKIRKGFPICFLWFSEWQLGFSGSFLFCWIASEPEAVQIPCTYVDDRLTGRLQQWILEVWEVLYNLDATYGLALKPRPPFTNTTSMSARSAFAGKFAIGCFAGVYFKSCQPRSGQRFFLGTFSYKKPLEMEGEICNDTLVFWSKWHPLPACLVLGNGLPFLSL